MSGPVKAQQKPPVDAVSIAVIVSQAVEKQRRERMSAEQLAMHDGNITKRITALIAEKEQAGAAMLQVLLEVSDILRQTRNTDGLQSRVTRAIMNAKQAGFPWLK